MQGFPAPPLCCSCYGHWSKSTLVGLMILPVFSGKALIPPWPYSRASMVSNTSVTLASLLLCGCPSSTSTETSDQRISPTHHPFWNATPRLISGEPGFIPFTLHILFEALSVTFANTCAKILFPLWDKWTLSVASHSHVLLNIAD